MVKHQEKVQQAQLKKEEALFEKDVSRKLDGALPLELKKKEVDQEAEA